MLDTQNRLTPRRSIRSRFGVPKHYNHIWKTLLALAMLLHQFASLLEGSHELDWIFIGKYSWIVEKVRKVWGFH